MTPRTDEAFATLFDLRPETTWWAPGRVNLIGEHTDYNDGYVLPVACDRGVVCAGRRRTDRRIRVASVQAGGEPVVIDLDHLRPGCVDGWAAYPAGVAWALGGTSHGVVGADLLVDGDVPIGAGLASSAALEVSVAAALADLAGTNLAGRDPMALALVAHKAEHDFVGVPSGIMDQAAAVLSRAGHALLLDARNLYSTSVPFDPESAGLGVVVFDTGAPHRLADGGYAARRAESERAARRLGVRSLRELPAADLEGALTSLADGDLRRRVRHVITENERVLRVVDHLRDGDVSAIGPLLTASHESLRTDYEVTTTELDLAVDAALDAHALGARMTGGGFGGSVLALVELDALDAVVTGVWRAFEGNGLARPSSFRVIPGSGTHRVAPDESGHA